MKLEIDNLDGLGAMDYSAAVAAGWKVVRTLNAPSTLEATLVLEGTGYEGTGLAVPVRRARVKVHAESGAVLFTGYLTTEPVEIYAGVGSRGPVYRLAVRAVSDEWLLDRQAGLTRIGPGLGTPGGQMLRTLVGRLPSAALGTAGVADGRPVGVFEPDAAATWSQNAGAVASSGYGAYRVLDGGVSLATVGGTTHALRDGDGTLSVAALKTGAVRELANDVTLTGGTEPVAFWTELFRGDGVTSVFELLGEPQAVNAGHAVLIDDGFAGTAIDGRTWAVTDPGSHFSLSSAGLTLGGGNGLDGQTTLTAYDAVELGGTVVVELDDVTLGTGSAGVLGGLYGGRTSQGNCFAGFNVRQAGGNTVIAALVNGVEAGAVFTLLDGHRYTLRVRVRCAEMVRVKQAFHAMSGTAGNFAVQQFGGGLVSAPVSLVLEVRDLGVSSNTPVSVLYDGALASSPATCSFAAVNSLQLFGSVGAVRVLRTGSGWVRGTDAATGVVTTRLVGAAGQGLDCALSGGAHSGAEATGRVSFFAGRVPGVGDTVAVQYRGRGRAVARLQDVASVAAEAAGGAAGTARWLGRVTLPPARTSEDCEAAAAAVLSSAANRAAAVSGSYAAHSPAGDVWPGDVLSLAGDGEALQVIVRTVTIEGRGAAPEANLYRIGFANDWAEGLGVHVSEAIAKDALLPGVARDAALPAGVLANLQQLTVAGTSGSGANFALTVDAGVEAPAGGGFEVRRRDAGFGQGSTGFGAGDLILRSPVRGFSIPVAAVGERFYVRMYDGSSPRVYSRVSSAVVTHLPIA